MFDAIMMIMTMLKSCATLLCLRMLHFKKHCKGTLQVRLMVLLWFCLYWLNYMCVKI